MKKKHTSQFWIGRFDSADRFYDFVGENPDYWSEENEGNGTVPLSKFIASQGEIWFDHDFIEAGFNVDQGSVFEKFQHHSYVEQWADPVEEKLTSLGIESLNAFIMMGIDEPEKGKRYLQVSNPCSYEDEGIELFYIDEFSYFHDLSWLKK